MTTQHTPGPWRFQTKWCDQVTSNDGVICIIAEYNANGVNRTRLVNRANARLIAAAPDMLYALRRAVIALAGIADRGAPVREEYEIVSATIAKATGEQT